MSSDDTVAHEEDDERVPMDLVSKSTLVKTTDSGRQISQITQLRVNRSNSGVQTGGTLSVTHAGISAYAQTMLKQVSVSRSSVPQATNTARPQIVHSPSTSFSHVSTSYHVPRGAAAVANISVPRSAVATPIVRPTTTLQTSVITTATHTTSFPCLPRAATSTGLLPQSNTNLVSSNAATWITTSTSVPLVRSVSPGPLLRTSAPQNRMQLPASTRASQVSKPHIEPSPRSQPIRPSVSKPTQVSAQLHVTEKYFKSSASMPSSVGTVTIAQVLPARTQGTISYSSPVTATTVSHFPLTAGSASATLISGQPHQLSVVPGQSSTTVLTSLATRLTMSVPTTTPRPTLNSTNTSVITTPTRLTMSQATALLATPARLTVASATVNQVSCPTTPVRPVTGTVLGTTPRLTSSTQGAVLTGQSRLAVPSTPAIRPSVSTQLTSPARIAATIANQNALIATPSRFTMSSSCGTAAQGTTMLTTQMRLAVPSGVSTPAGVVSLHPLVVSNTTPTIPLKAAGQGQPGTPVSRTVSTHQALGPKILTQTAHGTSIQLTPVPVTTSKATQPVPRTLVYTTTTATSSNVSAMRPITVAPATSQSIPVAKVFPTAVGIGRSNALDLGATTISEVLPVHAVHGAPQQPTVPQGTSVFIQASHRASPAPSSQAAGPSLSTYTLPTTYFYETSNGYQVGGPLVARPFAPTNAYTLQTTPTTQALRSGIATQTVHKTVAPAESSSTHQNSQAQTAVKPSASPRPSILRKRDSEGSPMKAQKNLGPVLAALTSDPISPPSPSRPDSRGNGGNSSGGSTTISATSSPGLNDAGDDSLPPTKTEILEESEKPPIEMSPRKKPRKQQLTGNELPEPKFSEDEMEFISESKVKEVPSQPPPPPPPPPSQGKSRSEMEDEKMCIPKRPHMSLIKSYRHTWKSRHNHFIRYSDVKPKDDRRPTITDIANQKNVQQKLNGWKVYHLGTQMLDLADMEAQVLEKLSSILKVMEQKTEKEFEKDVNRLHELIKGNMQRSKIIRDQMQDAETQVKKIFDHKEHVSDIISRCATKRVVKKRDKS